MRAAIIPSSILIAIGALAPVALAGRARSDDEQAAESDSEPGSKQAGKGDKEKPVWNVDDPPGPKLVVPIDTDEGTWLSLDVSPQGDALVFDLLGDIYALPIDGGEARPLTEGMAWDMQPRFSPDGSLIAFTSDRGGGDNIWVMKRDGSDPKPVTSEDFRLLNSPSWTPDGDFIAARKHFSSQRSLGAGEIWLFHRTGGKGVQMTKKESDQKDTGEPAFSPDGRYLYFSQDVTPGKYFEYNKDPHDAIYAIKRLDREDGELETYIHPGGGAVRPTPSPDGTRIAFVRRDGLDTVLAVHDIASASDSVVYRGLDRDMQETWAIHGVYPSMAWTPDSHDIVFWAGGKLRRVDSVTGAQRVIPFHVRHSRTIVEALRYPVEVHPERVDTKLLRWVEVAPDGASVLFEALGHIYVRPLPDGTPRRLTRGDDVFEFYPSFSRDGREVVYVSWSDAALGSVRIASLETGVSRSLTSEPGHYIEPVMSPDGANVVYSKIGASQTRAPSFSHEQGLYALRVDGGRPALLTRDASRPHFGGRSDRVYFMRDEGKEDERKTALKSIELDGSDERTHLESENATEYAVSPDGRWVAFREYFQVHITPFPAAGRPVEVGPKSEAIPLARVSRDAGEYLNWSADSRRLNWVLGNELYTRELSDSFAFLAGEGAEPEPPAEHGVAIGLSVPADVPTGRLALVGGRIVTMRGDEVIEDGTLVIAGNRIEALGPRASTTVPPDALLVDVSGTTLVPGFVDVHYHGPEGEDGITPQQNWSHYAALAFGVTTVHDPSHDSAAIFAASELARAGLITAPRIFSTGTILYGAKAPFKAIIDSLDDARSHLRRLQALGAISVKSYNQPRRTQRQQVLSAARELGMMVVPEGASLLQHNLTEVVDGHTGVEHALPIAAGYADLLQLWSGSAVGYTPTLVVGYGGLWGENYWYQESAVFAHPRLTRFVPPRDLEARARRRIMASEGDFNHVRIAQLCKALADRGVKVNVGAHGQREGLGTHWEMWMLVQGGMTPHQALRAGTANGAHYLGFDRDIGSLEPGKLADIAVIEGNVLEDIRRSEAVRYSVLNGRIYDASSMHQIGNHPAERAPFFWERWGTGGLPTGTAAEDGD